MEQKLLKIVSNQCIAADVYEMCLSGDVSAITAPGQFVNIKLEGMFLRRPISVCDVQGDVLTIIYKTVGKGTEAMSRMESGTLDILTGLGNGYVLSAAGEKPVLQGRPRTARQKQKPSPARGEHSSSIPRALPLPTFHIVSLLQFIRVQSLLLHPFSSVQSLSRVRLFATP